MMQQSNSSPDRSHLFAVLLALTGLPALVLVLPLGLSTFGGRQLEKLLLVHSTHKDTGILLQRMAFWDPHMLPVYGSSELTLEKPNRVDQFFASAPTGFKVCPVGAAANTPLMIAQKVAAQGSSARGRKLVVLLSFSWFRIAAMPAYDYRNRFSPAQATQIMLDGQLDKGIRRRLAERMLDYPDTLESHPELAACVREAAKPSEAPPFWLRVFHYSQLCLQHAEYTFKDDLEAMRSLCSTAEAEPLQPMATSNPFSWNKMLAEADKFALPPFDRTMDLSTEVNTVPPGSQDQAFIDSFGFDHNKGWTDFELMLDTFKSLDINALIIAIPIDGLHYGAQGASLAAIHPYYDNLEARCARRGYPLEHFPEHDLDKLFLHKHSDHLSGKGWLFADRLIDDFYHDRLPATDVVADSK